MMYVIRKGSSFYRANRAGYTNHIEAAGLYTKEEAEDEAYIEPDNIKAIPLSDFIGELTTQQRLLDEKWLGLGLENNLITALRLAIKVADEAAEEWDKAPEGMKAGKLLLALAGHRPGYRSDIDAIHAALPKEPRKMTDIAEPIVIADELAKLSIEMRENEFVIRSEYGHPSEVAALLSHAEARLRRLVSQLAAIEYLKKRYFDEMVAMSKTHDWRVTGLLEANNAELARRREATALLRELVDIEGPMGCPGDAAWARKVRDFLGI